MATKTGDDGKHRGGPKEERRRGSGTKKRGGGKNRHGVARGRKVARPRQKTVPKIHGRAQSAGPRPRVVVLAKAPIPGQVKTRLLPALRPEEAASLYRALLVDTIDSVESAGAEVVVAFTPATARRSLQGLLGSRRRLLLQSPGDLGERISGVLAILQEESPRPILVIGSDCPGLTPELVEEAWKLLQENPVVLGPSLDGGFYLLGVSGRQPDLRSVPWSTDRVLQSVRETTVRQGLEVVELRPLRDLDTPRDLFEWYASAREEGLQARYPRTWNALHSLMSPRRFAELEGSLVDRPPST